MVGLLPLCAVTVFEGELMGKYPEMGQRMRNFLAARPELAASIHDPARAGQAGRRLASILNETRLRRVLAKLVDESEFFGPYGVRALCRYHADHPYVFNTGGQEYRVDYLPGESDSGMFGGNSNWRGPVWMPVNGLIVRALLQYYAYYGDDFKIECPTGSGRQMTLYQVAEELSRAGWRASSCATGREGARSTARPASSRTTRTGATSSCSTSTSMATPARASAPATRPAGPASWRGRCTSSPPRHPSRSSSSARPRA